MGRGGSKVVSMLTFYLDDSGFDSESIFLWRQIAEKTTFKIKEIVKDVIHLTT